MTMVTIVTVTLPFTITPQSHHQAHYLLYYYLTILYYHLCRYAGHAQSRKAVIIFKLKIKPDTLNTKSVFWLLYI